MGYAFQKSYSSSLSGVLIENISIFNNEEGVRNIDLTSGDANTTDLVIGCTGFTCSISFSDIENAEAKGYLRNGENVYLNPYFVSLNPRDGNANIFNRSATIRLALPPDATTPWIVRADGFYGTREDILRYGTNIAEATILEDRI
jgi:hypothetical protein